MITKKIFFQPQPHSLLDKTREDHERDPQILIELIIFVVFMIDLGFTVWKKINRNAKTKIIRFMMLTTPFLCRISYWTPIRQYDLTITPHYFPSV
jgi:hypothetical protein